MVSLVQAREKRNEARAILDEGKDPAIVKKLTIEANRKAAECTFKKIAKEWHEMFKSQWASVHADDVIRSLERDVRSEAHTSELQSLMRISYAVICFKKNMYSTINLYENTSDP